MTFMCSFPQEELGFLYFPPPLLKKKISFLPARGVLSSSDKRGQQGVSSGS